MQEVVRRTHFARICFVGQLMGPDMLAGIDATAQTGKWQQEQRLGPNGYP